MLYLFVSILMQEEEYAVYYNGGTLFNGIILTNVNQYSPSINIDTSVSNNDSIFIFLKQARIH